jgi:outer membrane lipoprotein-sorting protein
MKNPALVWLLFVSMLCAGQNPGATEPAGAIPQNDDSKKTQSPEAVNGTAAKQGVSAPHPGNAQELETVLAQMDRAAANFKSTQADFEWDQYQKVVDETDKQIGHVYFRRNDGSVEALFNITSTPAKQVLFKGGKISLYDRKIDQVTEREAGKNRSDVEAFLGLGFGARGHDLLKSYDIRLDGSETVDGIKTPKLELVAKSPKVRNMFNRFILWIDLQRDVPLKEQVFEPSGDYWLAHYTNFKLNAKIPDDNFRLQTSAHTKVVKPQ